MTAIGTAISILIGLSIYCWIGALFLYNYCTHRYEYSIGDRNYLWKRKPDEYPFEGAVYKERVWLKRIRHEADPQAANVLFYALLAVWPVVMVISILHTLISRAPAALMGSYRTSMRIAADTAYGLYKLAWWVITPNSKKTQDQ